MAFSDRPVQQPANPTSDKGEGGVRVVVDFAAGRIVGPAGEPRRPGTPGPPAWSPPSGDSAA